MSEHNTHPVDQCRQLLQTAVASTEAIREHVFHKDNPTTADLLELGEVVADLTTAITELTLQVNGPILERFEKSLCFDVPERVVEAIQKGAYTACVSWLPEEPHIDVSTLTRAHVRLGLQRLLERAFIGGTRYSVEQGAMSLLPAVDNHVTDVVIQLALFAEVRYA